MMLDRTWCAEQDCPETDCYRNMRNIELQVGVPYSMAFLKGTEDCTIAKGYGREKLTIQEIGRKGGMPYNVVYQALSEAGILKRGKNVRYDVKSALQFCVIYLHKRIRKENMKLTDLKSMLQCIENVL